jgi:HSP20 family molecular chaperone IbpA
MTVKDRLQLVVFLLFSKFVINRSATQPNIEQMISSTSLYRLSKVTTTLWPKLAGGSSTIALPAIAVGLSNAPFSTSPKQQRSDGKSDELYQKSYSDAFDESDALETGKQTKDAANATKESVKKLPKVAKTKKSHQIDLFRTSFFDGFDDAFARDPFFAPFFDRAGRTRMFDPLPVLRNFPFNPAMSTLLRSSPGYEIKQQDDGTYEIAMDIPEGVKPADIKVEMDGNYLHVSGHKSDGMTVRFDKRFAIGKDVDVNQMKANFADSTLVVTAPKVQIATVSIPITQKPHSMSQEEVVQTNYSDAFDESDVLEAGKQVRRTTTELKAA